MSIDSVLFFGQERVCHVQTVFVGIVIIKLSGLYELENKCMTLLVYHAGIAQEVHAHKP